MLDSVVFPAPFSPSSACTSPAAASKLAPSFATTPGNRFVIPTIRTEGGEAREPVLDRAVVEAGLPRAVHRCLDPAQVVRPPVVDRCGQPLLRSRALRVRVVAGPRDAVLLGVDAGSIAVHVLAEDVHP